MSNTLRLLCSTAVILSVAFVRAADAPKESPFSQAGTGTTAQSDTIDFAGVTSVGKKTMINLYDKAAKRSFWVEAGTTSDGITVVKYDSDHDQVTIRQNGTERTLPLRPPSAVANAPAATLPPVSASPGAPGTATPTSTSSLSQARQEEEARMLVSDLLEIGMAQRKAYEDAQRRAAAGQNQQQGAQPTGGAAQPQPGAPAQPATSSGAGQATATATPSGT